MFKAIVRDLFTHHKSEKILKNNVLDNIKLG